MPSSNSFKTYFQNTRGLRTKTDQLFSSVSLAEFDCISLVETWLSEDIVSSEYFPSDYVVFRSDRRCDLTGHSIGGGVLVAIRDIYTVENLDMSHVKDSLPNVDIVGCKCMISSFCLYIYVIYVPPDVLIADFEMLLDSLELMVNKT